MIGHLGSRVSALLDGRLSPEEEEKAWEHVHACHFCRDLVEREGWVKTQLATLGPARCLLSDGFKSSLMATAQQPDRPEGPALPHERDRRRGVLVLGSSAAGVAFLGVAVLSGVFNPGTVDRRPTMTNIEQAVNSPSSSATGTSSTRRRVRQVTTTSSTSPTPSAPTSVAPSASSSTTPTPSGRPTSAPTVPAKLRPVAHSAG